MDKAMKMMAGAVLGALAMGPMAGMLVVGTCRFLAWLAGADVIPMGVLVPLSWAGAVVGWFLAGLGLSKIWGMVLAMVKRMPRDGGGTAR